MSDIPHLPIPPDIEGLVTRVVAQVMADTADYRLEPNSMKGIPPEFVEGVNQIFRHGMRTGAEAGAMGMISELLKEIVE